MSDQYEALAITSIARNEFGLPPEDLIEWSKEDRGLRLLIRAEAGRLRAEALLRRLTNPNLTYLEYKSVKLEIDELLHPEVAK